MSNEADEKIGEYVRSAIKKMFADSMLSDFEIENLKDKEFSKNIFNLNYPALIDGNKSRKDGDYYRYYAEPFKKGNKKYYLCNHWFEDQFDDFQKWEHEIYEKSAVAIFVKVYAGYSWEKDKTPRSDKYWCSILDYLNSLKKSIENRYRKDKVYVNFNRLRAKHGSIVLNDIKEKIADADILIFDVADTKSAKDDNDKIVVYTAFNTNVMFEIGLALQMGKYPILMCPNCLKNRLPSDLSNYMWTFYDLKKKGSIYERVFADTQGLSNLLMARMNSCARAQIEFLKTTQTKG